MVLTRIPSGASSSASVREKLVTAAFMPVYTAYPGAARCPSIDVMLMMLPPSPCFRICTAARWVLCNSHPKFARMTASQPRELVSTKSALNVPPATFTSTSSRPKRSTPSLKVVVNASASRTSMRAASGSSATSLMSRDRLAQQLLVLVAHHEVHAGTRVVERPPPDPGHRPRPRSTPPCRSVLLGPRGIPWADLRPRQVVGARRRVSARGRKRSRVSPSSPWSNTGSTGRPTASASRSTSTRVVESRTPSVSSTTASSCGTSSAKGGAVACSATVNVYTVPRPPTVVQVSWSDRHAGQRERG